MEEKKSCQPWLLALMKAKFHEPCNCTKANRAFFCLECLGLAFCPICDNNNKHDDHQVIRAHRATNQPGFDMKVIGQLTDICGIQPYSINSKYIVYINKKLSKDQSNQKQSGENLCQNKTTSQTNQKQNRENQCQRCGCKIEYSKFCSIECKVKGQLKLQEDAVATADRALSSNEKKTRIPLQDTKETFKAPPNSYRKRSRKGIPLRSPLM